MLSISYMLLRKNCRTLLNANPKYLLSLLNSKLISFYIKQSYSALGIDGGINFSAEIVEQLPIPRITEKAQQSFISIVDQILAAKKKESMSL